MKLSAVTLALAASTNAANVFRHEEQSLATRGSLKVPGENPLEFCDSDRDEDLITVDEVNLMPNPPQAGKALVLQAHGTIKDTIRKGAYVKIVVKYGLIQLLSTTADLCEQAENVDLSCPIEDGKISILKSLELPSAIPPGTYNVFADAYDDDDRHITCLKTSVNFPRPGLGGVFDL